MKRYIIKTVLTSTVKNPMGAGMREEYYYGKDFREVKNRADAVEYGFSNKSALSRGMREHEKFFEYERDRGYWDCFLSVVEFDSNEKGVWEWR